MVGMTCTVNAGLNAVLTLSQVLFTIIPFFFTDWCLKKNTDYDGHDIHSNTIGTSSPEQCQKVCQATPKCKFFSWNSRWKHCWLKSSDANVKYSADSTSGPKFCGTGLCYFFIFILSFHRVEKVYFLVPF